MTASDASGVGCARAHTGAGFVGTLVGCVALRAKPLWQVVGWCGYVGLDAWTSWMVPRAQDSSRRVADLVRAGVRLRSLATANCSRWSG